MRKKVLAGLVAKGVLVEPEALSYILAQPRPLEYIDGYLGRQGQAPLFLTLRDLESGSLQSEKVLLRDGEVVVDNLANAYIDAGASSSVSVQGQLPVPTAFPKPFEAGKSRRKAGDAREFSADISILKDITGQSRCSGKASDFSHYFQSRYNALSKLLRQRPELASAVNIEVAARYEREVAIIGMVREAKAPKPGGTKYTVVTLEDGTGAINVLTKSEEEHILSDEVIGVVGKVSSGRNGRFREKAIFADRIVRPETYGHRPRFGQRPLSVAFISDIHVGSKKFLPKAWERFAAWLGSDDPLARRVKYLVIVGDMVDGVGVFPSQEEELEIPSIIGQYEALGKLLEGIPKHVEIIMLPGNHDGVRLSEPQPALPAHLVKAISTKATYVGNPCLMELEGVRVLAYHGKGLDDYVGNVGKVSYAQPAKIMAEMLKRRHLCPIYGGKTQISPERTDHLVIETVPDIFVTGHIHAAAVQRYEGVLTINASTWQDQTPFQVIHNIQPDPGRVAVVDLDTLNYEVKRFC